MAAWLHGVILNDVIDDVLNGMLDGMLDDNGCARACVCVLWVCWWMPMRVDSPPGGSSLRFSIPVWIAFGAGRVWAAW